jgi:hypothetical protein
MKTFKTVAAAITASICVFTIASAVAQGNAASTDQGHYEWRHAPRSDPRVPLQGARHVWVPRAKQVATCDCDMMRGGTGAAYMKTTHGMAPPSGASAS